MRSFAFLLTFFLLVPSLSVDAETLLERSYRLKEGPLVGDITLSGNYPFLESHIRRTITLRPGDLYTPGGADSQARKIEDLYAKEGYEGTHVDVTSTLRKKGLGKLPFVNLHYRIRKGKRYLIDKIEVTGNGVFPHGFFVSQINPLLPFEPGRLRGSLEKIRGGYKKRGYLGAKVRVRELIRHPERRKIDLSLEINEGDHVAVLFQGNHLLSERTFHKILPLYTEGGYGSYDLESSRDTMLREYHQRGFQEVEVKVSKASPAPRELFVLFEIKEGARTRVKKISIDGNREVSDRKLKKEFETKEEGLLRAGAYRPETVDKDFENLPAIYRRKGYREAEAKGKEVSLNPTKDKATVRLEVSEGGATEVASLRLEGKNLFPEGQFAQALKKLKMTEGHPFSEEEMAADKEALVDYYANRGYPYVIITHQLAIKEQRAAITYQIDPGQLTIVCDIIIIGNQRTTEEAVLKALTLKKGEPFSYKKLLESEASLRKLGAFRSVDIETIGLAEKETNIHWLVKLEENKSIVTDLEASFNTDDLLTGTANIQHLNLFGIAKRANLKLTLGQQIARGELNFVDPRFVGASWEGVIGGFYEQLNRPGFDTKEVGGAISFLHDFSKRLHFLTKYQIDRTFFSNVTDPTAGAEHDNTTSKTSVSVSYDTRDSFSDPKRGFLTLGGIDFANKLVSSSQNFFNPKAQFVYYLSFSRFTLFNHFRAEGIKVIGAGSLPRDDRLFLGGDYTIRGFGEDRIGPIGADDKPIGGHILLSHTVELQVALAKGFKGAAFIDSGSLTDTLSNIGEGSLRHGAGVGLRYVTPIGPLRLDYAVKLDRAAGESLGRLHFAFGYLF